MTFTAFATDARGNRHRAIPHRFLRCINANCANPGAEHLVLTQPDGALLDPFDRLCPECSQPMADAVEAD